MADFNEWDVGLGESYEDELNHDWLKDRPSDWDSGPARPAPPAEAEAPKHDTKPADPSDVNVLATNEALVYALRLAPNVVYSRCREFGQIGVLGWCDEFRELIDAVIETGFAGALFTSTREAALRACKDLLKLNLDVTMQIITIYLASQVARLRRFLDGELQYEDYPDLSFPRPA